MNSENKDRSFENEENGVCGLNQTETDANDTRVEESADSLAESYIADEYEIALEPIFDSKKEKKTFSILGFGLACFTLVMLMVSTVIVTIVSVVAPEIYNTPLFMHSVTPVAMYLFALPVLLAFLSKLPAISPEKKPFKFGAWMLFVLVGFGLMYIGAQVSSVVMEFLKVILGYDPMNSLNDMVTNSNFWVNLLFLVVVAPVGEEFVFRKLIIDRTHKYGCLVSAMFSAVVFGLMHGNLYQCFYAFALGLLLGYLYYSTGKLYLTIGIHAVINFVSGVLVGMLEEKSGEMTEALISLEATDINAVLSFAAEYWPVLLLTLLFSLFMWGAIVCAIVLPIVFRKKIILEKGEVQIPRGAGFSTLFLSVGGIVMLVLYFIEIALSLLPN